ncbi:MAG: DNA polymerase III subunit alpha [Bacilli bacterium]|nr:DNA polymerase III subunit alpha [Bacilli bacterium]
MNYVPLYIKTDNSLLSSLITIKDLITYAENNNIRALTITDTSMYGAIEFYYECKKHSIKPIVGIELSIDTLPLILYCKNYIGYQKLLKLETIRSERDVTLLDLNQFSDELICIVPFKSSFLYQELKKIFSDIYIGYSNIEEREQVKAYNSKLVYCNPILYFEKKESEYLKYLIGIKEGVILENINFENKDYSFPLLEEIKQKYSIDLENNKKILENCNLEIETEKNLLPIYECPNGENAISYLKQLCKEGLKRIFGDTVSIKYIERLKYELTVIEEMGFCNYFLIVCDYVKYAKEHDILVGPGRGSAAGSLVAYLLNITTIDPIRYNLMFERFLNAMRITMPDIDVDFEYTKRDQVVKYCTEKYGNKKVASIITFGTLGSKQAIRDVGRVMNIKLTLIDTVCKFVDSRNSLQENYQNNYKLQEILKHNQELKKLYHIAIRLEGLKRHTSIHAAGIVMSQKNLDDVIPLHKNGDNYLTGYSMEYLESLGLLKMDFLALRNLTLISDTLKDIPDDLTFDTIPVGDEKAFSLFTTVNTMGIFQFESDGMKNFLRKFRPTTFEDIFAALALFRPGPMNNIDSYIKRKHGKEKIDYLHPDLKKILENTYGIIIYQEQIMSIANILAGYSLGEADILRRAMSKKKEEVLLQEKDKFIKRSVERGYTLDIATKIYDLILKFADYGFNRAHSVAYAMISYRMAYLKAHYPLYFMKQLLNMHIGSIKTKEYIYECKLNNIDILKPDINKSGTEYIAEKNGIRFPLTGIKNLGVNVVNFIITEREKGEFTSIYDFIKRTYGKTVNSKTVQSLINAGCFETFGLNKKTLTNNIDLIINYGELVKDLPEEYALKPELEIVSEYPNNELMEKELEMFGFYLSNHPVTEYRLKLNEHIMLSEIENYFDRTITVITYIDKIKEVGTKNKDNMCFVTGSDEITTLDIVLFPKVYEKYQNIKVGNIIKITGKIEKRFDKYQLIANVLEILE